MAPSIRGMILKQGSRYEIGQSYSHEEYRNAGVAHIKQGNGRCEYYHKGKLISEEAAEELVRSYQKKRK